MSYLKTKGALGILLLLAISAEGQLIKREVYYDANKTRLREIYFVTKAPPYSKNGIYKFYSENSILLRECSYKSGKLNGDYKELYDNGSLKVIAFFLNDIVNGKYTDYYTNGNRKTETTFVNGKENGLTKIYYENGNLQSEAENTNGTLNGVYKEFYQSGNLRYDAHFKMGFKDGAYKEYFENGKQAVEGFFVNNKMEGTFSSNSEEGDIIATTHFLNDKKDGTQTLYSKHKAITTVNQWSEGILTKPGKVEFNPTIITKQFESLKSLIKGTDEGVESDWIRIVEAKNPTGKNDLIEQKVEDDIIISVKISKKFSQPENLYLLFSVKSKNNITSDINYFTCFNLALYFTKNTGFDNYYNFGIAKLGKIYKVGAFDDVKCEEPYFSISIASTNPHPEYDKPLTQQEALVHNNRFPGCIAYEQEWNMNKTYTSRGQPSKLIINSSCEKIEEFINLFKLMSSN